MNDTYCMTNTANLPKTQAKTLAILADMPGEVSEYTARTNGANMAALKALTTKGYLTVRYGNFVMPIGPLAGETLLCQAFYTVASR